MAAKYGGQRKKPPPPPPPVMGIPRFLLAYFLKVNGPSANLLEEFCISAIGQNKHMQGTTHRSVVGMRLRYHECSAKN